MMNAYLTLDYELYMSNKTGTPQKCLFQPMSALTKVLDKHGIRANVFVDAAYLLRLKQQADSNPHSRSDYEAVSQHITSLSEQGQCIQLHFHPQWLYSSRDDNGGWYMDFDRYKMSDCGDEIVELLFQAGQLLQSLSKNSIHAFRAGGYSIMDFARYKEVFTRMGGVNIDTSVLRGERSNSRFQSYDYRHIPNCGHYRFADLITQPDETGEFIEYPISTWDISSLRYLWLKRGVSKKETQRNYGDGQGVGTMLTRTQRIHQKMDQLFGHKTIRASIDTPLAGLLERVYQHTVACGGQDFVIIGHPKGLTPWTISCLDEFASRHKELMFHTF